MAENPWILYEEQKQEIEKMNLSPAEYQKAIEKLCRELGI